MVQTPFEPLPFQRAKPGEGVDRRIDTRRARRLRGFAAVALGLLAFGAAIAGVWYVLGQSRRHIPRNQVAVAVVKLATFQESLSAVGTVLPKTTVYLDLVEAGRIEKVLMREGKLVREGQPILQLTNNDLQLRLLALEAQRLEQVGKLSDLRFRLQENDLEARKQLAELDFRIQETSRRAVRNDRLRENQLISTQELEATEKELEYLRSQRTLAEESAHQSEARHRESIQQMELEVARSETSYEVAQEIKANLTVKAPVEGLLSSLDGEIGELKTVGSRLGQIDQLADGYKVRTQIDEFYLNRVVRGQMARTLPISGKEFTLEVVRVFPEVREGKFAVDLEFLGSISQELRRGQTLGFQLTLGEPRKTLVLPRGAFFQATGGRWVYVLASDGSSASRRVIQSGRLSAEYLEILKGLRPGERVIVSSYERMQDAFRILLD